jgi:hypothetical protein
MRGPKPQPRLEAFEQRFLGDPNSGCWLWTANVNRDGYGLMCGSRRGRKQFLAHRIAWELFRGPIPIGMQVLHRCDTPSCVRPDHLFLGTHADNMLDKVRKGRQRNGVTFGDDNPSRKYPEKRPRGDAHWTRRSMMERQS